MSRVKLTQCLLFFVNERAGDVAPTTSASSIKFYALLPEVFKTEHPEFLKLFTENGITIMSASDNSSQITCGVVLEMIEILLRVTTTDAMNTLSMDVLDSNLPGVRRIFSNNTTIAINTCMNSYSKEVKVYPAVDVKNSAVMKLILSQEKNICYKHPSGENLLHLAARRGHETLVKIIIEYGIDVNSKCVDASTPLHLAAKGGYSNVVDVLLINGADLGSKTNAGSTALHMAAEGGHLRVVEILIRNCADLESKTDLGSTALSLAVRKRDLNMVKLLLSNGADPDCRDQDRRTPLLTTEEPGLEVAEVLLSYGARLGVILTDGQFGPKALHLGSSSLIQLLLESCFRDPEVLTFWGAFSGFVRWTIKHFQLNREMVELNRDIFDLNIGVWPQPNLQNFHLLCPKRPDELVFAEIYGQHLIKMIPANLYPLPSGIEQLGNAQVNFKAECEFEIMRMKERTVGNTCQTFFDILKTDIPQIALFLRNTSVAETLSSADLHTAFPNYAGFLKWQFQKGNQRKLAIEEGVKSIDSVSGLFRKLPREVKENILDYLSVRDILLLKHAHAHPDE